MILIVAVAIFAAFSAVYLCWDYRREQRIRKECGLLYDPTAVD